MPGSSAFDMIAAPRPWGSARQSLSYCLLIGEAIGCSSARNDAVCVLRKGVMIDIVGGDDAETVGGVV